MEYRFFLVNILNDITIYDADNLYLLEFALCSIRPNHDILLNKMLHFVTISRYLLPIER